MSNERELGVIEQRLSALESRAKLQNGKLDELIEMKHQIEGGKKAVTLLVTIAATVGAAVGYVLQHMSWKF
jgi:predicted ribosome quality control (RQC) complex YloA/Tae2 family protein